MQLLFGIGALWGQRTDVAGVGPDQFAILQENSVDFTFEVKELYSQLGYPVDIARGKAKVTGKAKVARVFAALYADIFFGETAVSGEQNISQDEYRTLAASTATVAHASTFVADLGVFYASTASNIRFSYSSSAPTAPGMYTTGTNGIYTFFSGDVGSTVAISYVYTDAFGKTITINNHWMGYTPTFMGTFYQQKNTLGGTGQLTLRLNQCVSSHFTLPSRLDDYSVQDLDWQAFARSSDNTVGTISMSE